MKKLSLLFAALFTATVFNLNADGMDTLFLNTGGSTLWNQAGAKFSVWYWNDGEAGEFTDFLELAYGETDIYRAIIPTLTDSVIFVRHAATADVPSWDNKLHQTKADEVDLEIGNIMVITSWDPADREWDHYTPKQAPKPDMHDFLYFVGLNGNDTVRLNKGVETTGSVANLTATFEYSKDRINWTAYDTWGTWSSTTKLADGAAIALAEGDTVFFRAKGVNGKNAKVGNFINEYYKFTFGADDQIAAGGNVMSLYDATCEQDTMTAYGFCDLFSGASQLVSAPKLPATKMAAYCYNCMFKECTSLTQAPELKATTLATKCYRCMFDGCTALTQAPALPADSLALSCYNSMFDGCTALTAAPELKATTLAEDCYSSMFYGCTALTQAPELKATTLAQDCYENMFYGCTSLQVDTCTGSCDGAELVVPDTTDAPINYWAQNMFFGCKGAYTNIQLGGHYCVKEYVAPDMHDFLYFVSLKDNGTVQLNKYATDATNLGNLTATFEYSKDRKTWTAYTTWATDTMPKNTYQGTAIALAKGDTVFFRAKGTKGKNATLNFSYKSYFNFAFGANDSIAAGGNTMSLYDATCEQDTMTSNGFYYLFKKAAQLVSAPKLPATQLATSCYTSMFYFCKSLTQAPALPATELKSSCYKNMFQGCSKLTQAPELKATTLAESCYYMMFTECTSLEVDTCTGNCDGVKFEPTHSGTDPKYWNLDMFYGCKGDAKYTESGQLIQLGGHYCVKEYKAPDMHDMLYFVSLKANGTVQLNKYGGKDLAYLTATFEYSKDRINWTEYTWGGTDNKKGAAITLANAGDTVFFRAKGTKGKNATMSYNDVTYFLFAFNTGDSIAAGGNVMSLYDAECKQDTMTAYGFCSLFRDCAKKLVSVSELKLPVTKLAKGCYYAMFYNCMKITDVPALPVTTLAPSCYVFMFYRCTSLTVAPALPATTLADNCYSNMFSNCTALTQAPELNATVLAPTCYNLMFASCSSLTSAPELKATTLAHRCYSMMFQNCKALTQAPELKATTLADSCYCNMFKNCSKLEVNTFSLSCDGAELVVPDTTAAPLNWNKDMFIGCHVNDSVKLGGHYCIRKYVEPVCKIGTKGYASIAAAVAAVQAGDTIQVIKDIQLDAMIEVPSTTPAFTLDLNGHILDGSNLTGNNASLIRNEGTLSIIDSDPTATHEAPFDTIAGAIMTGGKGYKDVNNTYGGAIYSKNGTLNVNGVAFVTNSAFRGGAVWLNGSNSTFTNCRFYGNTDTDSGAAVGINNNSQCSIDSCVIKGNSTKTGTIYAYECSLTIAHTTITDNTSSIYCGAMYVLKTSLTLGDGTVVTNNTSADTTVPSGGIYVWTEDIYKNSITLSGKVIIKDNTSNGQPANLCLSGIPTCDSIALNGLSAGSEVYVSTMINDKVAPVTFATNATEADLQYFVSDNGYAFVLDKNGKIVSKEAYGRKVTSGNYGTISLDKQFIAMEGVEALYVPSYKDASKLYCSEVKLSDVKAGGAYIFKANADSVTFAFEGEAVAAAINNDHMIGWLAADSVLAEAPAYYLLSNNQIIKPEAGSTILKNRAFIDLANVSTNPPSAAGRYIALGINEATGLENAEFKIQNSECKMLINGQLIIIKDGVKYNAQGQKLE